MCIRDSACDGGGDFGARQLQFGVGGLRLGEGLVGLGAFQRLTGHGNPGLGRSCGGGGLIGGGLAGCLLYTSRCV